MPPSSYFTTLVRELGRKLLWSNARERAIGADEVTDVAGGLPEFEREVLAQLLVYALRSETTQECQASQLNALLDLAPLAPALMEQVRGLKLGPWAKEYVADLEAYEEGTA